MIVRNRWLRTVLLITPTLILLGIFIYGVSVGVLQGFGIMPSIGADQLTLEYYGQALSRPDLLSSLGFSLYISLVSAVLAVIGGVILSALLTRSRASRSLQLLTIGVALVTAHILVVLAMTTLFSGSGLLARLLHAFGIVSDVGAFPSIVSARSGVGVILVYLWKEIPFVAFMTLTIMMNISSSLGEAARTLGASPSRAFFTITLPLCSGAIARAFLIVFAFSFGAYEVPDLLGPTTPKMIPVLAYLEFTNPLLENRMYAMAINGIITFITLALAAMYFYVMKRGRVVA